MNGLVSVDSTALPLRAVPHIDCGLVPGVAPDKSLHRGLIKTLVDCHGFSTAGCLEKLRKAVAGDFSEAECSRIPDAFKILPKANNGCGLLIWAEVEVSRPLDTEKFRSLTQLWWDLDCESWALELWCIDRFGRVEVVSDTALAELWATDFSQQVTRLPPQEPVDLLEHCAERLGAA